MQLPLKINAPQYATEVLEFYNIFNLYKSLNKPAPKYLEIGNGHYSCFLYYQLEQITQCQDKIVFIDCFKEGWHVMFDFGTKWPKDKHYFILSSADWDESAVDYKLDLSYTLLYFPWVLFDTVRSHNSFNHELYFSDATYNFDYPKQLSFTSLCSSIKPHRDFVVKEILPQLSDNTYVFKYAGKNFGADIGHLDIVKNLEDQDAGYYSNKANDYFQITRGKRLIVEPWHHLPIDIYNMSYYNLVTESDDDGTHFFPTEKIWKPLIAGIPFVCMATHNFLKRIRDLGFKTYDSVWDESYDAIKDYQQRLDAIKNLCVKLENFDWNANRDKLIQIANHNKIQMTKANEIFAGCFTEIENRIEQYRNSNI